MGRHGMVSIDRTLDFLDSILTRYRIWTSEIFSMNVRAQAVGMAAQSQNIANAILQQFFPTFLANCGWYTFYFFAGINLLLAIFVFFLVPETRKVKLEEIDTLFGGANHVEKGATILGIDSRNPSVAGTGHVGHVDEISEARGTGVQGEDKAGATQIEQSPVKY